MVGAVLCHYMDLKGHPRRHTVQVNTIDLTHRESWGARSLNNSIERSYTQFNRTQSLRGMVILDYRYS